MSAQYAVLRDVRVPMTDGTELAADVWLPAGEGPFPTLLQRTPYGRDVPVGSQHIVQMDNLRALDAGFAIVIQDTRGRLGSGGDFEPFVNEAADGVDTVAWVRAQDFSDGNVLTYGASYVGATQMLLAAQGPEGHLAMAPFLTTADYHHTWTYQGGAFQLSFVLLWITEALGPLDAIHRGLDPDHPVNATIARMMGDPLEAMSALPVMTDELRAVAPYVSDWAANPTPDTFWPDIRPLDHVDQIHARGLHIVGLNDIFATGSVLAYRALRDHGATPEVRDGQYLVLGPWSHGNIGDWQGDQWLGYSASAPAIDLCGMQLGFFRAAVDGRDPDLPRVRYFVSGANQWHTASEWPPPDSRDLALHLGPESTLSQSPATAVGADRYVSDPADPVPTAGGQTFYPGLLMAKNSGPRDQRDVEARADVLVYRSEPLDEATTVAGPVRLEIWASSSATDCDWTGRLVDVHPDGSTRGIGDGIVRSRYRDGSDPQPLTPGRPELFTIEIGDVAHQFAAGHRIGLQIASSNFPRFDRNPQQMLDPLTASAGDLVVADQTVHHGPAQSSRLVLTVLERDA